MNQVKFINGMFIFGYISSTSDLNFNGSFTEYGALKDINPTDKKHKLTYTRGSNGQINPNDETGEEFMRGKDECVEDFISRVNQELKRKRSQN